MIDVQMYINLVMALSLKMTNTNVNRLGIDYYIGSDTH